MAAVAEWDEKTFAEIKNSGVVLADFYAVWCGPCRMMMSVLEKAAAEFADDQLKAGKLNIEQCKNLAAEYNIRTIPTFIIFKDGEIHSKHIGVLGQKMLTEAIRKALA
ncbi:MAG: thioredoxin family protein [Lentisphaeria bacterium]|nr:thioredoxin family protein [Lentisphaeria bacterium]